MNTDRQSYLFISCDAEREGKAWLCMCTSTDFRCSLPFPSFLASSFGAVGITHLVSSQLSSALPILISAQLFPYSSHPHPTPIPHPSHLSSPRTHLIPSYIYLTPIPHIPSNKRLPPNRTMYTYIIYHKYTSPISIPIPSQTRSHSKPSSQPLS